MFYEGTKFLRCPFHTCSFHENFKFLQNNGSEEKDIQRIINFSITIFLNKNFQELTYEFKS